MPVKNHRIEEGELQQVESLVVTQTEPDKVQSDCPPSWAPHQALKRRENIRAAEPGLDGGVAEPGSEICSKG